MLGLLRTLLLLLTLGSHATASQIIHHEGINLQRTIADAPSFATIICDRSTQLTISTTIAIQKPLTLKGLNAALVDSLGRTPILRVQSEDVSITDFELYGNAPTVDQSVRAPLISIEAGSFRVERGRLINSSKDGVEINPVRGGGDIVGGVVRDLVGDGVVRDLVSIQGSGRKDGYKVRNILVDNVRGSNSSLRGVVEVSDGSDNITVRKVYAENCVYAIDVQDHKKPWQVNSNVVIQDVYAVDCTHAIRTANRPFGHSNLTIRDVVAERCTRPLSLLNTNGLTVDNVRIIDHTGDRPAVHIGMSNDVVLRDITINRGGSADALLIENANRVRVDGLTLGDGTDSYARSLAYRITDSGAFSGLRIQNVSDGGGRTTGIVLEKVDAAGTLTDYRITGNAAAVVDGIKGKRAFISGNLER